MLSRLSLRAVHDLRPCQTLVARTSSSVATSGERDLINYPDLVRPEYAPPTRLGFLPESWFTFFHSKTGVTGPYVFGAAFVTFLYSKEFMVAEHEFYVGLTELWMTIFAVKKFGPRLRAYLEKEQEKEDAIIDSYRDGQIENLQDVIQNEELTQGQAQQQSAIYQVKKENIGLQLEAAYRERLTNVNKEVLRRLEYQAETENVKNRVEQRHMVNWIVQNVKKSITPTQEAAALKQCITDLKAIVARA